MYHRIGILWRLSKVIITRNFEKAMTLGNSFSMILHHKFTIIVPTKKASVFNTGLKEFKFVFHQN